MTGLKILLAVLALLMAIPYVALIYLSLKMTKELDEILNKELEEIRNDN